jgi:hypothetical protein
MRRTCKFNERRLYVNAYLGRKGSGLLYLTHGIGRAESAVGCAEGFGGLIKK